MTTYKRLAFSNRLQAFHIIFLIQDFRNVWGVLTKEEIVDMFSDTKRDNIAGCVKFIVSDNKELQLEQAGRYTCYHQLQYH